jgi:hypothetical protein
VSWHIEGVRKCFPVTPSATTTQQLATSSIPVATTTNSTSSAVNTTELVKNIDFLQTYVNSLQTKISDKNITLAAAKASLIAEVNNLKNTSSTSDAVLTGLLNDYLTLLQGNATTNTTGARRKRQTTSPTISNSCLGASDIAQAVQIKNAIDTNEVYSQKLKIGDLLTLKSNLSTYAATDPNIANLSNNTRNYIDDLYAAMVLKIKNIIIAGKQSAAFNELSNAVCGAVAGPCGEHLLNPRELFHLTFC